MLLNSMESLIIILVVAITTFATRAFPFLVFPEGRKVPMLLQYLGKVLTPAIIGMLVIYCLKSSSVLIYPHGIPEMIAVAAVIIVHIWKRNNLLSIGIGTGFYMFLVQGVFV